MSSRARGLVAIAGVALSAACAFYVHRLLERASEPPIDAAKLGIVALVWIGGVALCVAIGRHGIVGLVRRAAATLEVRPRLAVALLALASVAGTLLLAEGSFAIANRMLRGGPPAALESHEGSFIEPDPELGYALRPGGSARIEKRSAVDGRSLATAIYTIDPLGRRHTPQAESGSPRRAVAFFGGSFVFGDGLDDDETLPARYAAEDPGAHAMNFGVPGHGPHHVLARLQSGESLGLPELPEPPIALYLFIDHHPRRAIGSMQTFNLFGRRGPYYALGADGTPLRRGDFLSGRPLRSIAYWLAGKSQIARFFGLDWPPGRSREPIELSAAIARQCEREFVGRTGGRFFTLIYPGSKLGAELAELLRAEGAEVLDFSSLFEPTDPGMVIPEDGHPSDQAIRRVARALADALPR